MTKSFRDYGFAVLVVGAAGAVAFAMYPFFELTNLVMVYLLGVLAVASRGQRGPAALSSALSVLSFDFFFVPPRFSLGVTDAQYAVTFVVMFAAAMIISHLTIRLRSEAEAARQGQRRTAMMHAFTQQLAATRGVDGVISAAVGHLARTFQSDVIAFGPAEGGSLKTLAASDTQTGSEKELGVAQWVYDRAEPAGLGTQALPVEDALYIPLVGAERSVGVLKVKPASKEWLLAPEQRQLLDSFAHQIALALEVDRLQEIAKKSEIEAETERLRSSLLSSVSHDFRTPLTAIVGSAGALLRRDEIRKSPPSSELVETIQTEGERLSRLVQNLLETTRLESGRVRLRKELYPLEEVVGSALERLTKDLRDRDVKVDMPEDLPPAPIDGLLIEQLFINLLENAIRHTPPGSSVRITVSADKTGVNISVADSGPGLKEGDVERVFDKFYHGAASPGAGLGLAICRAIVNAHGGKIWAENQAPRGAVFHVWLPLGESHEP